jgi:hypothetical protein
MAWILIRRALSVGALALGIVGCSAQADSEDQELEGIDESMTQALAAGCGSVPQGCACQDHGDLQYRVCESGSYCWLEYDWVLDKYSPIHCGSL